MGRLTYRLRPVDTDFLDTAPVRLVFSSVVMAPPRTVYRALAEDVQGWSQWFGLVRYARPTAAGRHIVLAGGVRFDETVLIAEEPGRYVYRGDATNRPGVRAIVEEWRVEPLARCSMVQWTMAVEPAPGTGLLLRGAAPVLRASFRRAMGRLDRRSV
jgi:Polyketide cyclase / dehydrase and lipid transport